MDIGSITLWADRYCPYSQTRVTSVKSFHSSTCGIVRNVQFTMPSRFPCIWTMWLNLSYIKIFKFLICCSDLGVFLLFSLETTIFPNISWFCNIHDKNNNSRGFTPVYWDLTLPMCVFQLATLHWPWYTLWSSNMKCKVPLPVGMYSVRWAVCSVRWAVCILQCAVCSVWCAMWSVQCAVCSVQCAVCSVQCAACNVKLILYLVFPPGVATSS